MSILIKKLSHRYKVGTPFEKQVLFDIDLEIGNREFIGLIGPTQAGKTTLAQYFNGLFTPAPGHVWVDGQDLADQQTDLVMIRHRVGYVFQNPENQLFKDTVGEDVAFAPKNQRCSREEVKRRVRESLDLVGLDPDTFIPRDIYSLSGGQKRRAAIAGVLAGYPNTLVLDDPTAGLDPRGRREILGVIERLHREKDMAIVFISNSMDDIARLTQRIVVMNEGTIVMDGKPRTVFTETRRLRRMGLDIPETVDIMERLQARGFSVPLDRLSVEETVEAIAECLTSKGGTTEWN